MRRLLLKLCDFVETIVPLQPANSDYSPNPTTEIVQAAVAMTEMPDVVFKQSPDPNLVWVLAKCDDHDDSVESFDTDDDHVFEATISADEVATEQQPCHQIPPMFSGVVQLHGNYGGNFYNRGDSSACQTTACSRRCLR
jgi:hypothetical protein